MIKDVATLQSGWQAPIAATPRSLDALLRKFRAKIERRCKLRRAGPRERHATDLCNTNGTSVR